MACNESSGFSKRFIMPFSDLRPQVWFSKLSILRLHFTHTRFSKPFAPGTRLLFVQLDQLLWLHRHELLKPSHSNRELACRRIPTCMSGRTGSSCTELTWNFCDSQPALSHDHPTHNIDSSGSKLPCVLQTHKSAPRGTFHTDAMSSVATTRSSHLYVDRDQVFHRQKCAWSFPSEALDRLISKGRWSNCSRAFLIVDF